VEIEGRVQELIVRVEAYGEVQDQQLNLLDSRLSFAQTDHIFHDDITVNLVELLSCIEVVVHHTDEALGTLFTLLSHLYNVTRLLADLIEEVFCVLQILLNYQTDL
jgi:hypothetical protein